MEKSLCQYFYSPEGPEGHKCGYCKSPDTNVHHGMWTHYLTPEDYQDLIDRGWRRSGKYCYKPLMSKICCPMYTISCQATKFRLSKSQKVVLKKMSKYLVEGIGEKPAKEATDEGLGTTMTEVTAAASSGGATKTTKERKPVQPGKGADPSKPPSRKAKLLRKEQREKRGSSDSTSTASASGASAEESSSKPVKKTGKDKTPSFMDVGPDGRKPLEAFLTLPPPPTKPGAPNAHNLEVKLIRSSPPSADFKATFKESFALYKKYQMAIHNDSEEDCKESGYTRFLCNSPLIPVKGAKGWPCDYGSYHQHYRIDGKLVAVGVIDILPKCLSSVYVYYDPDYNFLNLGVYTALRETEMTRKLHLCEPETFRYYYMGYYIHSCIKMRYKGNYTPSFLLCPESYRFVPIEGCLPKLDSSKYSRLNDEESSPENVQSWLGSTLVVVQQTYFTYAQFCLIVSEEDREEALVREYSELVGPKVAARMLLSLS